jgi:hypothetical protein
MWDKPSQLNHFVHFCFHGDPRGRFCQGRFSQDALLRIAASCGRNSTAVPPRTMLPGLSRVM